MAINSSIIRINANKKRVWETITKPELVKEWQYGSDLQTTWEAGKEIRFRTEWEGQVFEQWGTVLEVRPFEIIKYNLFAPRPGLEDIPENYFVMSYLLTEIEGVTQLEILQLDDRPGAVQEEEQGEDNPILKNLKEVAERM